MILCQIENNYFLYFFEYHKDDKKFFQNNFTIKYNGVAIESAKRLLRGIFYHNCYKIHF